MGSTTKKSKVSASTRGMSPGQSMAMAGNTGLGGVKEKDAITIQNAIQNINRATGGNQGSSFKDIGQNIGEVGSKYRRPADVENYAKNLSLINDALNQGASVFTGPDGIQRVNFNNTGIKDDQGRTILSKQLPNLNATAPSLGQLGGDMSRALTGYNSLQYTDPSSNIPEMVNREGLASLVAKAAIPGSIAFNLMKDLYGKGKNFLFPIKEEEEKKEKDIYSSAEDATGEAFMTSFLERDLKALPIDEEITTPVTSVFPNFQGGEGGNDYDPPSSQPNDPPPFDPNDPFANLDPQYLKLLEAFQSAGGGNLYSQQDIVDYFKSRNYLAYGGTVAPKSGPMSAGIGTLYNTR